MKFIINLFVIRSFCLDGVFSFVGKNVIFVRVICKKKKKKFIK